MLTVAQRMIAEAAQDQPSDDERHERMKDLLFQGAAEIEELKQKVADQQREIEHLRWWERQMMYRAPSAEKGAPPPVIYRSGPDHSLVKGELSLEKICIDKKYHRMAHEYAGDDFVEEGFTVVEAWVLR